MQNKNHEPEHLATNEAMQVAVLGHIEIDNTISIRQVVETSGVSRGSIHRILRKNKYHPYKIHLVQELNEDNSNMKPIFYF